MKIKQISVTSDDEANYGYVYALLDDGSIYSINTNWEGEKWQRLPNLIDQVLKER